MIGDIGYIRTQSLKKPVSVQYAYGKRPRLPAFLRQRCPAIVALIEEMWDADFRTRPVMKDVVIRLEACVSVEGVVAYDNKASLDGRVVDDEATAAAVAEYARSFEETFRIRELELESTIARLEAENAKLVATQWWNSQPGNRANLGK